MIPHGELLRLLQSLPAPMAVLDRDLRYLGATRRWCELLLLDQESLPGRSHLKLFPQIARDGSWLKGLHRAQQGQDVVRDPAPFLREDGESLTLGWHLQPWRNDEGKVAGLVLTAEPTDAASPMAGEARELTRQLREQADYQRQLEAARDAAEQATRAKSRFLANMSHEIRTPINAILGFSQLLKRDGGLSAAQREHVETVLRSGNHLLALVNDVLEVSRLEAGMVPLNCSDFEILGLLKELMRMFSLRVRDTGVTLRLDAEGVEGVVHGDEGKIRQILINLLNNAVKFTDRGEITIRARAQELDSQRIQLRLEVCDTGAGIDSRDLKPIFEEFRQARNIQPGAEGTGLGLTICRQFIELMGGSIEVRSQLAIGSTFAINLPLRRGVGIGLKHTTEQLVVGLDPAMGRPRVLIVDDHPDNRRLLVELLGLVGFDTQEASGAREALFGTGEWAAELVIIDMHMPRVNGYQLISQIRAQRKDRRIPILAMSASMLEETRTQALEAGADAYLSKPFGEEQLFHALANIGGYRFEYRHPATAHEADDAEETVPPREAAESLPRDLARALARAAVSADYDGLVALIDELRTRDPALARYIELKATRMDYESILALVDAA